MAFNTFLDNIPNKEVTISKIQNISRYNSEFAPFINKRKINGDTIIRRVLEYGSPERSFDLDGLSSDALKKIRGHSIAFEKFYVEQYWYPGVFNPKISGFALTDDEIEDLRVETNARMAENHSIRRDRKLVDVMIGAVVNDKTGAISWANNYFDENHWLQNDKYSSSRAIKTHQRLPFREAQVVYLYKDELEDQIKFGDKYNRFIYQCAGKSYVAPQRFIDDKTINRETIQPDGSVIKTKHKKEDWTQPDTRNTAIKTAKSCSISDLIVISDWHIKSHVNYYMNNAIVGDKTVTSQLAALLAQDLRAMDSNDQLRDGAIVSIAMHKDTIECNYVLDDVVESPQGFDNLSIYIGHHYAGQVDISFTSPFTVLQYKETRPTQ